MNDTPWKPDERMDPPEIPLKFANRASDIGCGLGCLLLAVVAVVGLVAAVSAIRALLHYLGGTS